MLDYAQFKQFWQSFAFTNLLRTFRMAISPSKLVIAISAILIACFLGWFMDICTNSVMIDSLDKFPTNFDSKVITELHVYLEYPADKFAEFSSQYEHSETKQGVFETLWIFGSERVNAISRSLLHLDIKAVFENLHMCVRALFWAISYHTPFSLIYFSIVVVLLTITGGAICRCAALDFSEGAKPGLTEAIHFSLVKFKSLLIAPAIPFLFIFFCAALIYVLGLLGNIPVLGKLLLAVGMLPALVIGLVLSVSLLGTIMASMIMYPSIAYEGSDGFDAISRCYAYVFIKPLSFGLYTFIASVYGAICHIFVRFFAYLLLIITYSLISLGFGTLNHTKNFEQLWSKPEFFSLVGYTDIATDTIPNSIAGLLINTSIITPVIVVAAFLVSFYFCGCTIIYSLMRRNVDNTPTYDIYTHLSNIQTEKSVK